MYFSGANLDDKTTGLLEALAGGLMILLSIGVVFYIGFLYYRRVQAGEDVMDEVGAEVSELKRRNSCLHETKQPLISPRTNPNPSVISGNQAL